jgi:hypothetical protein
MRRTFDVNDKEHKALEAFEKRHSKRCQATMEVTFTLTGIGLGVRVRCSRCGQAKDCTDYDCW